MLRQVGPQLVVEEPVAVVLDEAVDMSLIGAGDAEGGGEILARQREAMLAEMRRADDDEKRCVRAFEQFAKTPGIGVPAARIVDVRHEYRAQAAVGTLSARFAGSARVGEKTLDLSAQGLRLAFITTDAARRPHIGADDPLIARPVKQKVLVQRACQGANTIERQDLTAVLAHRFDMNVL